MREHRAEEIARGITVVGPHRDDLRFILGPGKAREHVESLDQVSGVVGVSAAGVDATMFGSRGQQRTVALALKLAEVQLVHDSTGEMPILLLDDVLSELDQSRSRYLLETISHAEQVLITTTDLSNCTPEVLDTAILWKVIEGTVAPMSAGSAPS
jgi:DNA replication and repair protein RecF